MELGKFIWTRMSTAFIGTTLKLMQVRLRVRAWWWGSVILYIWITVLMFQCDTNNLQIFYVGICSGMTKEKQTTNIQYKYCTVLYCTVCTASASSFFSRIMNLLRVCVRLLFVYTDCLCYSTFLSLAPSLPLSLYVSPLLAFELFQ